MIKMHRGMLDKLVQIQRRTQTRSPSGQQADTWATIHLVYANIRPLVGRDYLSAKQLMSEITHDITISYLRNITSDMRIYHLGKYYEIASEIDFDEKREWLFLKCKEAAQ